MANEVVSTSKWYCFFLLNPAVTASFFETLAGGLAQPRAADFPSKVRPTAFSRISQSWRFVPHRRLSPRELLIADYGRCACFHLQWKQARAVVGVWSSRVGLSGHGANGANPRAQKWRFSAPDAQEFELLSFPCFPFFVFCPLCWLFLLIWQVRVPVEHERAGGDVQAPSSSSRPHVGSYLYIINTVHHEYMMKTGCHLFGLAATAPLPCMA